MAEIQPPRADQSLDFRVGLDSWPDFNIDFRGGSAGRQPPSRVGVWEAGDPQNKAGGGGSPQGRANIYIYIYIYIHIYICNVFIYIYIYVFCFLDISVAMLAQAH